MFAKCCAHLTLAFFLLLSVAACLTGCATHRSITVEKAGQTQADEPPPPADTARATTPAGDPVVQTETGNPFVPIMFDFDRYSIRDDQEFVMAQNIKPALGSKALILAGYCDERGTVEWNMALGQRRADTVRKALMQRGVTAGLRTVSYGKGRATGHDEVGWAMDRRVEIARE